MGLIQDLDNWLQQHEQEIRDSYNYTEISENIENIKEVMESLGD